MSTKNTCPHGGQTVQGTEQHWSYLGCGDSGWICLACREDKADRRADRLNMHLDGLSAVLVTSTDRLVEGLALAGLLANQTARDEAFSIARSNGDSGLTPGVLAHFAAEHTAGLREREGGE